MLTAVTITGPDADLLGAVGALRGGVAAARFPLVAEGALTARQIQTSLVQSLDDYLIPRLRRSAGPVHIVVGGSTGVGKSTLVNSILRHEVTRAGVLRPTTRSAVMCVNPGDVPAVTGPDRLLPAYLRSSAATERPDTITLFPHTGIPPGVTLIDAPDVNSVLGDNRAAGGRLLSAADAWILVTTAERYADAVPWRLLQEAHDRRVTLAIVLNRVPPDSLAEVREATGALLAVNGLGDIPLFTVPEAVLTMGLLPEYLLDPLTTWLRATAHDPVLRQHTITTTVNGLFDDLPRRLGVLAEALTAQAAAAAQLRVQADLAYSAQRAGLHDSIAQGELLRGGPLLEWQALITPDRAGLLFSPAGADSTGTARMLLLGAAADAITAAAGRAADEVSGAWHGALSDDDPALTSISAGSRAGAVPPELEDWANGLTEAIDKEPRQHLRTAEQFFAAGPQGPAVLLAALVFTGRRSASAKSRRRRNALAPHPAVAATRKLADAVFGAEEADRLALNAATTLDLALAALCDRLAFRHHRTLAELGVDPLAGKAVLDAGLAVQRAR
jgi:hypothetical protein